MANRDIGIPVLIAYLIIWWGSVAGLLVFITSNKAPGAPQIEWHDAEIFTTTKLRVDIVTDAPDADGDKVDYAYEWYKNGELAEEKLSSSVSSKDTLAGDTWTVRVIPDDGTRDRWGCNWPWRECAGAAVAELEVVIANTAPRARIKFEDAEGNDLEEWDGTMDVSLALSCFDPDLVDIERRARDAAREAGEEYAPPEDAEDPCTYEFGWYAMSDEPVDEEAVEEEAPAEEEEGDEEAEPELPADPDHTVLTLTRRELKASDAWKVVVIASDGQDKGDLVEDVFRKAAE